MPRCSGSRREVVCQVISDTLESWCRTRKLCNVQVQCGEILEVVLEDQMCVVCISSNAGLLEPDDGLPQLPVDWQLTAPPCSASSLLAPARADGELAGTRAKSECKSCQSRGFWHPPHLTPFPTPCWALSAIHKSQSQQLSTVQRIDFCK